MVKKLTDLEKDIMAGHSYFRGHPIIWHKIKEVWLYKDTLDPIPAHGGVVRPCKNCGVQGTLGEGEVDPCIGVLPGVNNACCGHGVRERSYIRFNNGVVIRGFIKD